jgi:hypothetical protein
MGPFAAFTARVSVALAVTTAALSVQGCGSGRPTIGSVRVTRVSRTNDTFLVEGSLNYAAGASDDPVKDVLCTVFPEGALEGLGAADDLHELLGDGRLARPVVLEREARRSSPWRSWWPRPWPSCARRTRSPATRRAREGSRSRGTWARGVSSSARSSRLEEVLGARPRRPSSGSLRAGGQQERAAPRALGHGALELVVDEVDRPRRPRRARKGPSTSAPTAWRASSRSSCSHTPGKYSATVARRALEVVAPLAADDVRTDLLRPRRRAARHSRSARLVHVRVERAAEAAIAESARVSSTRRSGGAQQRVERAPCDRQAVARRRLFLECSRVDDRSRISCVFTA